MSTQYIPNQLGIFWDKITRNGVVDQLSTVAWYTSRTALVRRKNTFDTPTRLPELVAGPCDTRGAAGYSLPQT